jgi:hypothetical protein
VEKSVGNVALIKDALVYSSILSCVYPLRAHRCGYHLPLAVSLTLCFVPSSYLRHHFSPSCLQMYRKDGDIEFLRQLGVSIPNISIPSRARSTDIGTKVVHTFQWNTFYLRCAVFIISQYVNYMNIVINSSKIQFSETQTVAN